MTFIGVFTTSICFTVFIRVCILSLHGIEYFCHFYSNEIQSDCTQAEQSFKDDT